MKSLALPLLLLAPALLAGGCTPHDMSFGDALRSDIALQVKDPDPEHAGPQRGSGEQAALAAERYRKGTVRQPVLQQTTRSTGGGGGSGSGAGSGSSNP